jgi:hypothetical protein
MLRLAAACALVGQAAVQAQGFERIQPPADAGTGCGRGAPYSFFFRPGTVNKVVIDFEGGGGCWDALTWCVGTLSSSWVVLRPYAR